MNQKTIKWQWIMFMTIICAFISGCGSKPKEHVREDEPIKTVHIKASVQKSIDLETITVETKKLITSIKVYGVLTQDTENTYHITSQAPGTIESIHVSVGETVEQKMPLATVRLLDSTQQEILSPVHGVVLAEYVKPAEKVDTLTSMMTIANPDVMKASFDVYEKDIPFIQVGQKVSVQTIAYPQKTFEGKVSFVSPRVDETARTVRIRVNVDNAEHLLKFGMSVTGQVFREAEKEAMIVPAQCVQSFGDKTVVFVKQGADKFEIRTVHLGNKSNEEVEIKEGLQTGEDVVTQGSFILKSEAMKEELTEGGHHHD